jgi:hypothetical protein
MYLSLALSHVVLLIALGTLTLGIHPATVMCSPRTVR